MTSYGQDRRSCSEGPAEGRIDPGRSSWREGLREKGIVQGDDVGRTTSSAGASGRPTCRPPTRRGPPPRAMGLRPRDSTVEPPSARQTQDLHDPPSADRVSVGEEDPRGRTWATEVRHVVRDALDRLANGHAPMGSIDPPVVGVADHALPLAWRDGTLRCSALTSAPGRKERDGRCHHKARPHLQDRAPAA